MKSARRWLFSALALFLASGDAVIGGSAIGRAEAKRPGLDFAGTMSMTGALVEGTVTKVEHSYAEETGPRTHVTLSDVRSHVGQAPKTVVLKIFGGPLPDGGAQYIAGDPRLLPGKRYLAFLTNRPWRFSPLARGLAYRLEDVAGKRVLVADNGRAALSVGRGGITFDKTPLFAPVDFAMPEAPALLSTASARNVASLASVDGFVSSLRHSFPELAQPGRAPIQLEPLRMDVFARR